MVKEDKQILREILQTAKKRERRLKNFVQHDGGLIIRTWKAAGPLLRNSRETGCLNDETILGYVRGLYGEEEMKEILIHLAHCPRCSVTAMEMCKEDKAAILTYIAFIATELALSQEEVGRAMRKISKERGEFLNAVAADLTLACCLDLLPREEIVRLASLSTERAD